MLIEKSPWQCRGRFAFHNYQTGKKRFYSVDWLLTHFRVLTTNHIPQKHASLLSQPMTAVGVDGAEGLTFTLYVGANFYWFCVVSAYCTTPIRQGRGCESVHASMTEYWKQYPEDNFQHFRHWPHVPADSSVLCVQHSLERFPSKSSYYCVSQFNASLLSFKLYLVMKATQLPVFVAVFKLHPCLLHSTWICKYRYPPIKCIHFICAATFSFFF